MTAPKPSKSSWLICLDRWVFLCESFMAVIFLFFILSFLHFILTLHGSGKWGSSATTSILRSMPHIPAHPLKPLLHGLMFVLQQETIWAVPSSLANRTGNGIEKISQTIWEEILWVGEKLPAIQPHRGTRTKKHYRKSVQRLDGNWLGDGWRRTAGRTCEVSAWSTQHLGSMRSMRVMAYIPIYFCMWTIENGLWLHSPVCWGKLLRIHICALRSPRMTE